MPTRTAKRPRGAEPVAVSRIGQRRQVVIPKAVFDALQLSEGDLLEVTAVGGQVSMKRKRREDPDDTLSAGEAEKLRHSMKQVREGKVTSWTAAKHELGL